MAVRRSPKKIVAIDWDVRSLRIVHASIGKRGVKIDRILSAAIPGDVDVADPAKLGPHIRRVLDQEGIGTRHAIVDIPREQVILKALSLPDIRVEELPGVVEIQIAKELPFAAGEGVIDFVTSRDAASEEQKKEVLVSVVRRELLQQYQDVVAAAGLKLDRVGLRPYANKVAVCEVLRFGVPDRVLFIDVRPTLTEIDVIRSSSLSFSRAASVMIPRDLHAPVGGGAGDEPRLSFVPAAGGEGPRRGSSAAGRRGDSIAGRRGDPLDRGLPRERRRGPDGSCRHRRRLRSRGSAGGRDSEALGITTELYNPAASFGWDAEEGAAAAGFSAALGLVLSLADAEQAHFDFMHPRRMVSAAKERLRKAPIAAAAAVLFTVAGIGAAVQLTSDDRTRLAAIQADIDAIESEKSDYEKFLKFSDTVRKFDSDQHVWVDVLYDVFSVLPGNDKLVLMDMDMSQNDGRVTLKTKAIDRDTATEVIRQLEDFRREGRDAPRFDVNMAAQTNKPGEKYPFWQDLRITVLEDAPKRKRPSNT